jgi:hypothetical protein
MKFLSISVQGATWLLWVTYSKIRDKNDLKMKFIINKEAKWKDLENSLSMLNVKKFLLSYYCCSWGCIVTFTKVLTIYHS